MYNILEAICTENSTRCLLSMQQPNCESINNIPIPATVWNYICKSCTKQTLTKQSFFKKYNILIELIECDKRLFSDLIAAVWREDVERRHRGSWLVVREGDSDGSGVTGTSPHSSPVNCMLRNICNKTTIASTHDNLSKS